MTYTLRLPVLAGAMAAAFCLATTASNEAVAQIVVRLPGITQSYYDGYGAGYNSGYGNRYDGYRYSGSAAGRYGTGRYGYTGYGTGRYGYGATLYVMPSYDGGYGYRSSTYDPYYRGLSYDSGSYRRIYNPNTPRYYSPYGIGGY